MTEKGSWSGDGMLWEYATYGIMKKRVTYDIFVITCVEK